MEVSGQRHTQHGIPREVKESGILVIKRKPRNEGLREKGLDSITWDKRNWMRNMPPSNKSQWANPN